MALSVITINPEDGKNDVSIDSTLTIEFDAPVDPFTLVNGINLFVEAAGVWSGPALSQLDTDYSDVLDINDEKAYYPLKYQIVGNTVEILPLVSLMPNKEHFIHIYPGNDASRYISKVTVGTPVITSDLVNSIDIASAYTGVDDNTIDLSFGSSDGSNIDIVIAYKGGTYINDFPFASGETVDIGELKFILTGTFDILDTITIPVIKAEGVSDIYEVKFTTSKYTTVIPRSNKIIYFGEANAPLTVVKTFPENGSINNQTCNPIIIKFSEALKEDQLLIDKIIIKKERFDNGQTKNIKFYYKIATDTLKIYMLNATREFP
jgi:hypothetical protein